MLPWRNASVSYLPGRFGWSNVGGPTSSLLSLSLKSFSLEPSPPMNHSPHHPSACPTEKSMTNTLSDQLAFPLFLFLSSHLLQSSVLLLQLLGGRVRQGAGPQNQAHKPLRRRFAEISITTRPFSECPELPCNWNPGQLLKMTQKIISSFSTWRVPH